MGIPFFAQVVYNQTAERTSRANSFGKKERGAVRHTIRTRALAALLGVLLAALLGGCAAPAAKEAGASAALPKITVGSDDYEPYNYLDETGTPAGIDVDLAKEAFSRMGYEPVFILLPWEQKDTYLADGSVDCLWGCFTMNGREDLYQWAGPYLCSRQAVVVRADSPVQTLSDLAGLRISVQATTKPEELWLHREGTNLPQPEWVYSFSGMAEVYATLRKGYADAICGHEKALQVFVDTAPELYRMLDESLFQSDLGVAFGLDFDESFVSQLSQTLQDMQADGTTAAILKAHGLSAEALPGRDMP